LVDTEDVEDSGEEQEVAVAEWTQGANPVSCKWVKQQEPARGFDFDKSKVEQIFDLLLREKQLKLHEGHKFPTAQELQGRSYIKWHHLFTHNTNDCKELHRQIQPAIEQGRLILGQFTMKVDTWPFPGVNMVEGLHDADWIFRSMSTWQVHHNAATRRRGPVPAIGPRKAKRSTSPKNR
jgi:hypothetical protein